jgi:Zn finger protein HypA/HybF involved in hydrogenase expression
VQLSCPECQKNWESTPSELPTHDENFSCPNCHATRRTAVFMRTDRDLENLKRLK